MNHDAIMQLYALPWFENYRGDGRARIVGVRAEGMRGEQSVIAHVPAHGMPEAVRIIEHGDSDFLSAGVARIIHPVRFFAPAFLHPMPAVGIDNCSTVLLGH